MEIRPHRIINRKKTKKIMVGKVPVGGDSVISVQSMTNTLTTDVKGTIKQIIDLDMTMPMTTRHEFGCMALKTEFVLMSLHFKRAAVIKFNSVNPVQHK